MGYPIINRNLDEMLEGELLETPFARGIVRKAQAQGSTQQGVMRLAGTIWGTFSARNGAGGYEVNYTGAPSGFPDGTDSMSRYADMTGVSEARLLVNVAGGGGPGTILTVSGAGEEISVGLEVITVPPEFVEGTWHPVTASGATLLTWTIEGLSSGSVTVGLCQLQVK